MSFRNGPLTPAQLWLNIGYTMVDPELGELFIALPTAIPLDGTWNTRQVLSKGSALVLGHSVAGHDLHKQIMDAANTLQPGDSCIIGTTEGGLSLQLRRIKGEATNKPASSVKIFFVKMKTALADFVKSN